MYKFKQKSLTVDSTLYERVLKALQPHYGRCTDKDVDKGLEEELCKVFLSDGTQNGSFILQYCIAFIFHHHLTAQEPVRSVM